MKQKRKVKRTPPAAKKPTGLAVGSALHYPVTIERGFGKVLISLTDKMIATTEKRVLAELKKTIGFDAHDEWEIKRLSGSEWSVKINGKLIGVFPTQAQAEIEKKKVKKKIQDNAKILAADKVVLGKAQWKNLFKQKGSEAAKQMITLTDRESAININRTLREISKDFSLKMTFMDNPAIAKKVKGELWKNAQKITSIPDAYHDRVVKMLVKSGARGGDMTGMTAKLMDIGDMTRRQARNLSLDQTRKAYSSINAVRMKQNNMSKFQWLHSGGGANPREYHMHYAPAGLNGGIFELADPPVIDPETGERGLPGDLSHCGCTMKPIIDFDQYEDEA